MSKPRKTCIFCGNTGMSKEHIWGKWLKDYVRQDLLKHGMFTQVVNRRGTPNTEHLHIKSGDPLQSKFRVVCTKCNNEWLSAIQDQPKPHLIPLFTGTTRVLGVEAQEIFGHMDHHGDHDRRASYKRPTAKSDIANRPGIFVAQQQTSD
jgi:hypothetical protein